MGTIPTAILLHLNTLTIIYSVLSRDVITTLAGLASQSDFNTLFVLCHFLSLNQKTNFQASPTWLRLEKLRINHE